MARPPLEVADIFRDHGPAWRLANAGHVSLGQLKVMSAIERCRTAALGGHVARCEDCAHEHIAYNSCRNRHCPKCQAGAARGWLVAREAELLPVGYFHVVFTLPAPIADIAYQNKRVLYDLLMRISAETILTIAADPKHLGARIAITSVLHTWGSAMTHHPHVHMIVPGGGLSADGSQWLACRPNFLLSVRVLSRLFRRLFLEGLAKLHATGSDLLRRSPAPRRQGGLQCFPQPPAQDRLGRLRQATLCRARGGARLSQPIHPSRRHRQLPPDPGRRRQRHLPRQGLPHRRARPLQDHDPCTPRVHPPLPHPRPPQGPASHPSATMGFLANGNRAANIARIRELLAVPAPAPDTEDTDTANEPHVLALPCPCCGGRLVIVAAFGPADPPHQRPVPEVIDTS